MGRQEYGLQSVAQHIVAPRGPNEEQSNATTRGGEYNEGALRGHWENTRAAYDKYYCDGCNQHQTYYREDGDYGTYNSDGYYTDVELEDHEYDSCGCDVHAADYGHYIYYHGQDGYGDYNSEGEYACASISNYNDGSCGYTSYEDEYGCDDNTYGGGNHCDTEYGGYYNDYVGAKNGGYETIDPPTDDDSGPTSREGGRRHRKDNGMCGIAEHTPTMATILKRAIEREEMAGIIERPEKLQSKYDRLAENRFAALREEEEEKHSGYSTVNNLCATNKARGNKLRMICTRP